MPPSYRPGAPVVLAGDYNVVPTDADMTRRNASRITRSCSPRLGRFSNVSSIKAGSTRYDAAYKWEVFPGSRITPVIGGDETQGFGSIVYF